MLRYLPLPYHEVIKSCSSIVPVAASESLVDGYYEYYRPFEFSIISDLFAFTVSHSVRLVVGFQARRSKKKMLTTCLSSSLNFQRFHAEFHYGFQPVRRENSSR